MDNSLFDLKLKMNEASNPCHRSSVLCTLCVLKSSSNEILFFKHCALFHGVTMKLKVKIAITRPFMAASGSNSKRNMLFLFVVFLKQVKCFNLLDMITSKRHKFRIHCHSTPLLKNGGCTCTRGNELLYPLSLKFILLDSFYLGVADWRKPNQKSIKHNQSDCSSIGLVLEHHQNGTFRWVQ